MCCLSDLLVEEKPIWRVYRWQLGAGMASKAGESTHVRSVICFSLLSETDLKEFGKSYHINRHPKDIPTIT